MRQLRILPLMMIGAASLFALKAAALVVQGGLSLPGVSMAVAQEESPAGADLAAEDLVAEKPAMEDAAADGDSGDAGAAGETGGNAAAASEPSQGVVITPGDQSKSARTAVLERLSERARELDRRARDLDLKENLLKAAENRIAVQLEEMRDIRRVIEESQRREEERKTAQLQGLVTMYENMKPKDAARIFNGLELGVLIDLVDQMNARRMAEILGQMHNDAAERLTVEIARRADAQGSPVPAPPVLAGPGAELPKIEGRDPT